MGFYRQEYWSGWPFPSPGDLSDLGIELDYVYLGCACLAFCQTSPLDLNLISYHLFYLAVLPVCSMIICASFYF